MRKMPRLRPLPLSRLLGPAAILSGLAGATPGGVLAQASPHGVLPEAMDCSACHTAESWSPLLSAPRFTHGEESGFYLTGAHVQLPCAACHLDLRFDEPEATSDDCVYCHVDVHSSQFLQPCAACHTTSSFHDVAGEDIHARTGFPLTGAHRQITCESCHTGDVGGVYSPLDVACESCHLDEYRDAAIIDHVANGYPTDCAECHSTLAWPDAPVFDHAAAANGFQLLGAHTLLRCASCHVGASLDPIFPATSQDQCIACHQADYDREHGGSVIPTTCLDCHTLDDWDDADFDHDVTGFPLIGEHAEAECTACHGPPVDYASQVTGPDDCIVCHQRDYDKEHGNSGFPTTCADCHNPNDWDDAHFDHDATRFPLTGGHRGESCNECHGPPVDYAAQWNGPQDCIVCHQRDYDEEHRGSNTPTTCADCHNTRDWDIDGFQLVVSAASVARDQGYACLACHPGRTP